MDVMEVRMESYSEWCWCDYSLIRVTFLPSVFLAYYLLLLFSSLHSIVQYEKRGMSRVRELAQYFPIIIVLNKHLHELK